MFDRLDVLRNLNRDQIFQLLRKFRERRLRCNVRLSGGSFGFPGAHQTFSAFVFDMRHQLVGMTRQFHENTLAFSHLERSDTLERINDRRNIAIGVFDQEFLEPVFFKQSAFQFAFRSGPLFRKPFRGDRFSHMIHVYDGNKVARKFRPVLPEIKKNIGRELRKQSLPQQFSAPAIQTAGSGSGAEECSRAPQVLFPYRQLSTP